MINNFSFKDNYTVDDLVEIMRILRAPGGCPWDREQTHQSIRMNFIEETYEAVDAIDRNDMPLLKEELGDVLMQVVFHSEMEREKGLFDFDAVADGVCKKLIERHPHVFSDLQVGGSSEVLKNWDSIKKKSKGQTSSETLKDVTKALPALMRSSKVQHRAARAGFDFENYEGALQKLREETVELEAAAKEANGERIEEELGDVLFSAVNTARLLNVDAENALTKSCNKFIARFERVEKLAEENGSSVEELSMEELDKLWEQAKRDLSL